MASPASASAGLFCEGKNGWVDIAMGRLIVVNVLGASAEIGGKTYSTGPERGEGEPFILGQAFGEGDDMMFDFVDPNIERILVGVRIKWNDDLETWSGQITSGDTAVDVTCVSG